MIGGTAAASPARTERCVRQGPPRYMVSGSDLLRRMRFCVRVIIARLAPQAIASLKHTYNLHMVPPSMRHSEVPVLLLGWVALPVALVSWD